MISGSINWCVKKFKVFFFKGDNYHCPYCGYSSKNLGKFGSKTPVIFEKQIVGAGFRRSRCYNCGSSDRERLVYAFLEEEINFFHVNENAKVLHISPEPHLSKYIRSKKTLEYVGGDLFTEGYSYPEFVQNMDITQIAHPNNYFDLIVCNHVLEHIPNDSQAISELYRVLIPGGLAILQVPISLVLEETFEDKSINQPELRTEYFGQYDHVRIYGQDYSKRLSNCGFNVSAVSLSAKYPKLGLNDKELLFIAKKL